MVSVFPTTVMSSMSSTAATSICRIQVKKVYFFTKIRQMLVAAVEDRFEHEIHSLFPNNVNVLCARAEAFRAFFTFCKAHAYGRI